MSCQIFGLQNVIPNVTKCIFSYYIFHDHFNSRLYWKVLLIFFAVFIVSSNDFFTIFGGYIWRYRNPECVKTIIKFTSYKFKKHFHLYLWKLKIKGTRTSNGFVTLSQGCTNVSDVYKSYISPKLDTFWSFLIIHQLEDKLSSEPRLGERKRNVWHTCNSCGKVKLPFS